MVRIARGWIVVCVLAASVCTAAPGADRVAVSVAPPATAPATAPARLASGPIRVFDLAGDPAALGAAHGQLLKAEIRDLHARYFKAWFRNAFEHKMALLNAALFDVMARDEHRQEIVALAKAIDLDPREVMLGSCFVDMIAITACSTVTLPADAAPDGVARFGRNLDFPGLDIADKHSVVLVYRPAGRHAFAAVSWPGLVGVMSGMNEHGLALANMEVRRERAVPRAMPYALLYRTLLERCRTVDEAVALLEKTPRQTANNLMLMDAAGARAVVEITPDKVTVRRAADADALMSTNHQRGADAAMAGRCRRYDFLHDAAARDFGRIDVPRLQSMLAGASQGKFTLQSMIFEPSTRVLYLAVGADAARREFQRIDLKPRFARKD